MTSIAMAADTSVGRRKWPTHIVVFLAPAFLVYTVFSIYPLIDTIRLSLYTADDTGRQSFIGLGNFVTLLSDPNWSGPFWRAFRNNLVFFAIHMIVQTSLGLALAGVAQPAHGSAAPASTARCSSCRRCFRWSSSDSSGS